MTSLKYGLYNSFIYSLAAHIPMFNWCQSEILV